MKYDLKKEELRCPCGGTTKGKILKIEGFRIRGSTCPKCGESYLNGEDAYMLSEYRKLKDQIIDGKIVETGNSYTIRIPIGLVRALGLKKGDKVKIQLKGPKEMVVSIG